MSCFGIREPLYSQLFPTSGYSRSYDGMPTYGLVPSGSYSYGAYAQAPARDNVAHIRLIVPADAKVWFDDKATSRRGAVRRYDSPALKPGLEYSYTVKAQWRDDSGKEVTRTRDVDVSAGANVTVDFTR